MKGSKLGWGMEYEFHVAGSSLQFECSLALEVCVTPGQSVHLRTFLWETGLWMWLVGRQFFKDGSQMLILLLKGPSVSSCQCWHCPVQAFIAWHFALIWCLSFPEERLPSGCVFEGPLSVAWQSASVH